MRVWIERPHPDYPFVWVRTVINSQNRWTEKTGPILELALADRGITLLGEWATDSTDLKAPALLEDEHVKPKKRRRK